ncbi:hypothetical protein A5724_25655 [Mycobacterium sp. ACS1612]|nr:hypothetical protein A5724_25655 [Mycobacterium sp. ACS1612]
MAAAGFACLAVRQPPSPAEMISRETAPGEVQRDEIDRGGHGVEQPHERNPTEPMPEAEEQHGGAAD